MTHELLLPTIPQRFITYQPDPEWEVLAELATYRRQLLDEQTMVRNQAQTLADPELHRLDAIALLAHMPELARLIHRT